MVIYVRYKKEKFGIYGIFVPVDGVEVCIYVGRGELADRKSNHKSLCRYHKHKNLGIQEYWDLYDGENTFDIRKLEYCLKKEYREKEQYWIDTLKPLFNKSKASTYKYNTNTYKKKKIREHRSAINSGELNPRCRIFNSQTIKEVKRLIADGVSLEEIAEKYRTNKGYIYQIKNGNKWSSVTIEDDVIL